MQIFKKLSQIFETFADAFPDEDPRAMDWTPGDEYERKEASRATMDWTPD
jgi:hypothetical protein